MMMSVVMPYSKKREGGEMEKKSSIAERYFEKPSRLKTSSGIPVKETYTPDDIKDLDYQKDIGNPGEFPYTRGIFKDMYRGRMWSLREICGYGSPRATNERLKFLMSEGETAMNVIGDLPTECGLDSDHPMCQGAVGVMGVPLSSLRDMEIMMEGLRTDEVSMTLSIVWMPIYAFYIALAEKQGVPLEKVRATFFGDPHVYLLTRYLPPSRPIDMGMRMSVDTAMWCNEHAPRVYTENIGAEGLRESGATAAEEIAADLSIARAFLKAVEERGGKVGEIARRVAFTQRVGIDILEEAAKFRAARRIWAKMLRNEFGIDDPRALTYKVHAVTKGTDYTRQQVENNIIRIAYQALAAVLGGVQSMHTMSYDEPVCLPTEESVRVATRTQQILAYETGVINVADPLGGSYYVESLTNELEREMIKLMDEWKDNISPMVSSERLLAKFFDNAYQYQREIESGERTLVGVNKFTIGEEGEREEKLFTVDPAAMKEQLDNIKDLKRTRDYEEVKRCLENVRKTAERKEGNLFPAVLEAAKAYATLGEITGAIRLAYGYPYDPYKILEYPFA